MVRKYKTIPLQFENEQKYINFFKNIFFLEIKANLVTSYTKQKKKKINIICESSQKIKQYTYVKFKKIKNLEIKINDIIFLNIKKENSKEKYSLLGLVEIIEEDFFTVKAIVPYSKQEIFSLFFKKGKNWNFKNLLNLSSFQREWMKLINLDNLFLKKYILNPKIYKNENKNYLKLNQDFYKKLKTSYNNHQLGAIKFCLKKKE